MRKWIEKILPGYSVLPLILAVSINMLVYFGTSQLRDYLTFHTITTALDEWIPFVAPFILFYVLAYIQWIAELSAGCPGRKRVLLPDRLRRCGSKSDLSVVLFIFSNDTGKTGGDRKRILQ